MPVFKGLKVDCIGFMKAGLFSGALCTAVSLTVTWITSVMTAAA